MTEDKSAWKNRIVGYGEENPNQLLANPLNFRIHPKDQQAATEGSLDTLGWIDDVIINKTTGHVVDGHLRVTLALRNNAATVPVKYVELTEEEEAQALISLDPIAAMAATDKQKLDTLIHSVQSDDKRVMEYIAELAEREGIQYGAPPPDDPGAQIDKAEELREKWQTATGQLWKLGEHRLICGDCTDRATVERVMQNEKARIVFTSPPYADQREYELGEFDWLALANGMFDALPIGTPCDILVNLGLSYKDGRCNQYWQPWLEHCESIGYPLYGWYVWDKGSGFPGEWNGRLSPAHEWLFHFSIGRESANKWIETTGESAKRGTSGKRFRQKDGSLRELTSPDKIGQAYKIPDSVIRVGREMARGIHTQSHPAVFSEEFAEFGVNTWSDPGSIVYEPFCGSGTVIIACERLNRKCRACEISPAYVGVALQRFYDMTGITPELIEQLDT